MKNKVRWGVIGSGGIARRRTIPEGIIPSDYAQLISVYDIDQDVNKSVAQDFGTLAASNIEDLLNSGIDTVYVASPVNMHLEHVSVCARHKKHVLCEKPLGLTIREAEKIVTVTIEEDVFLGIGLMNIEIKDKPFESIPYLYYCDPMEGKDMKRFAEQRGKGINLKYAEGFRQHLGHSYPKENKLKEVLGELVSVPDNSNTPVNLTY